MSFRFPDQDDWYMDMPSSQEIVAEIERLKNEPGISSHVLKWCDSEEIKSLLEKTIILENFANEQDENCEKDVNATPTPFFRRLLRKLFLEGGTVGNPGRNAFDSSIISKSDIEQIQRMADKGSSTAKQVVLTIEVGTRLAVFLASKKSFNENEKNFILNLLYECCTTLHFPIQSGLMKLPEVNLKLKIIIIQLFSRRSGLKSKNDMKVLLSYIFFVLFPAPRVGTNCAEAEKLLRQGIQLYPNNVHFYDLLATMLYNNEDPKSSLHCSEEGLRNHPHNVNLLYSRAYSLHTMCEKFPTLSAMKKWSSEKGQLNTKVKAAYLDFLHHAPQDDWQVPHAYYNLAYLHLSDDFTVRNALDLFTITTSIRESKRYYDLGNESENNIPPCFLSSDESNMKKAVESVLSELSILKKENKKQDVPSGKSQILATIIERKPYLNSPTRHQLILNHRKKLVDLKNSLGQSNFATLFPKEKSQVTPITLKEINRIATHAYQKGTLELTIIDDLYFDTQSMSLQLVVEDGNGDAATRLSIFNIMMNDLTRKTFGFGCKISIANPGVIKDSNEDGEIYTLEIDDLRCVKYLLGVTNMCRFCGQANASHSCSICKRAGYCTKECQTHDWKLLKHKLVCSQEK